MTETTNLSFSYKVKEELSAHFGNARHCQIAELSAIVNICGGIASFGKTFCLKIQTENFLVAKKCFTLLQNTFNIRVDISVRSGGKRRRIYLLLIRNAFDAARVLMATGILHKDREQTVTFDRIYPPVTAAVCCRRAYLRGAFLASGSVNNPEKNYHLEFVVNSPLLAADLQEMVNSFGLEVIYLKEGEQIVDLLNVMEAHLALMELENVRIVKEMRNDINRKVNCETANLNKVVGAAVKQLEDIMFIQSTMGLQKLPPQLAELAEARLQYPEKSLKELGSCLSEPLGKSGVNHRLRKISAIAETLREGKGEGK